MSKVSDNKQFSRQITQRFLKAIDTLVGGTGEEKMTSTAVCKMIGMENSNLTRLRESADSRNVTLEQLARLSMFYNISSSWLLLGIGEMKSNDHLQNAHKKVESGFNEIDLALKGMNEAMEIIRGSKILPKASDSKSKTVVDLTSFKAKNAVNKIVNKGRKTGQSEKMKLNTSKGSKK